MPAKMFVGTISFQATEEDLRELFHQSGTVESVRIVTDQFTGRPRGFGFVEMSTKEEAAKAVEMLNGRLFRDRTLWTCRSLVFLATPAIPVESCAGRSTGSGSLLLRTTNAFGGFLVLGLGRLGGIGAEQTVFEGSAIEAADDRVHFFCVGGIDESEAFGFLSFGITDDLDGVGHQTFGSEPGPDIVRGHPDREVSEKYGKAHSYCCFLLRGD